ncbi:hypothetical protein GQ43DRAFT_384947 [Delitschia confertaspora ATCC 74209]|uniref:C2H2-type domain-containing protein n=1 Tax=Delitschia confertaspora ATCC 74209 TaxID=1513339 RepID=A0A9P4K0K2_9PLEO|nr:hypothetical protein GQ43DRAFT_384947 [Delitschia confertaspora ATCC 74209]
MVVSKPHKRKAADSAKGPVTKKACKDLGEYVDNHSELDIEEDEYIPDEALLSTNQDTVASDLHADPEIVLTVAGTLRAASEASRLWKYVCSYEGCGKRYNRPCRLESHERTHRNERPFACTEEGCGKTFPRKEHLTRHIDSAHANIRQFKCDWEGCGKELLTAGHLRRHKQSHEKQEMFRCRDYPPCNETFRKQTTLDAHIRSKHLDMNPYACTHTDPTTGQPCTAAYSKEGALRKHIANLHSGNRYTCNICTPDETLAFKDGPMSPASEPVGFPTYSALQAHISEVHPPMCNECHKKFATIATLRAHIEIIHEAPPGGNPSFPCPEPGCERSFTKRGNLNVHVQSVHQKVKRFICGECDLSKSSVPQIKEWNGNTACGQAFGAKCTLEQHIQTQHLSIKLNKKHIRQAKKQGRRRAPAPSALAMLTGVGYDEGRDVACLIPGCEHRYQRDYELRLHLRGATHGLSEDQIEEMIAERDALQGGQFWIGGVEDNPEQEQQQFSNYQEHKQQRLVQYPEQGQEHEQFGGFAPNFDPNIDPTLQQLEAFELGKGPLHQQSVLGYITPHENYAMSEAAANEEMDAEMGLTGLPAVDVHSGMMWDPSF